MKPYHKNPRQITKRQMDDLGAWLSELGDLSGIVHDLNTDEIIGGNQRGRVFNVNECEVELTDGPHEPDEQGTVSHGFIIWKGKRYAYRQVRWTEKQAEKANIVANKAGGGWDFDILANEFEIPELLEWGFDAAELGIDLTGGTDDDAEPQLDRAEELREQRGVEPGQLWRLPSRTPGQYHALICGDCTDAAVVERVMGGETAEMVWTDPPYGVSVGDKNKYLNSIAPSNRVEENLTNDTLDEPQLVAMLCAAFDLAIDRCTAGAAWHVAAPPGPLHVLFGQVLKDRGIWRQTIQWVKNNATFAPLGVDYHWRAEPIFCGWVPNAAHRYYGGRKQDTVWEIDRPQKSPEHPTMKPVELVMRAIENHTRGGEIVCDPFLGSGTTIIAAENLGRQCRAVEISPGYVAVALQRYVDAFGIEPELVTG